MYKKTKATAKRSITKMSHNEISLKKVLPLA
jgi:hypothetical protein